MGDLVQFEHTVNLTSVEFTCGHTVYMTDRMEKRYREHGEGMWCTHCGTSNSFAVPKAAEPPRPKTVGEKVVALFRRGESK